MHLRKVISGGQTGVDRAGLDAAIHFGVRTGGTAPLDGWADDGTVPGFYGLVPLTTGTLEESVRARTVANVHDGDVTVIIRSEKPSPGTDLTERELTRQGKLGRVFVLPESVSKVALADIGTTIARWLETVPGSVLNIAGPRESEAAIYWSARESLVHAFQILQRLGCIGGHGAQEFDAIDLFKHWDMIRWQGPLWLTTAAVVAGTIMPTDRFLAEHASDFASWFAIATWLLMGAFGTICVILQANLIHYHRTQEAIDYNALRTLPFSFSGIGFFKTAAFWLLFYTIVLAVTLCLPPIFILESQSSSVSGIGRYAGWAAYVLPRFLIVVDIVWVAARLKPAVRPPFPMRKSEQ
jgi:hypothetical protein